MSIDSIPWRSLCSPNEDFGSHTGHTGHSGHTGHTGGTGIVGPVWLPNPYSIRWSPKCANFWSPLTRQWLATWGRRAIFGFVFLGKTKSKDAISHYIALRSAMWETTLPRNAHAGFCKDFATISSTRYSSMLYFLARQKSQDAISPRRVHGRHATTKCGTSPYQTTSFECRTNVSECLFEALFNDL